MQSTHKATLTCRADSSRHQNTAAGAITGLASGRATLPREPRGANRRVARLAGAAPSRQRRTLGHAARQSGPAPIDYVNSRQVGHRTRVLAGRPGAPARDTHTHTEEGAWTGRAGRRRGLGKHLPTERRLLLAARSIMRHHVCHRGRKTQPSGLLARRRHVTRQCHG